MQPQAQDRDITLQVTVEDNLPLISGNKSSIEAMFINLISNAIKYTHSGGQVSIGLKKDAQHLQIMVSDTWIGIEEKDILRIFDKFYRVGSERTKYISGSGLGLTIVKGVVDAHYGSINVKSAVGEGTTFTVLLPIR